MKGTLSLRGFRKLRTGAIVATGVFLIGLASIQTTVQASEEDGVWVARTVEQVKADIQKEDNFFKYEIKWGDTLSVISEATNIPVDVLKEMNRISDRNLFLPHNELLYTEGESVTDSKIKHKIVIKESYGKKEVRTYEVVLQKNNETAEVSFELKETTEKVQESNRSVVSYDEVYNLVSEQVEDVTEMPTPAQPVEETPAAPGVTETPTPAQSAEEQPAGSGVTETPAPTKPAEEHPVAPGATETPAPTKPAEEHPAAPGATETPAPAQPAEEQPAAPGATETPTPAQPAEETPTTPTQPEGETSVDKEDSVKKAKDDSIKENIMTVYNRKLEIINKLSDENEKNKLRMGLETLKNEAVAAITEANDENKVISVTEHYQTAIDGFEVPGEEFNGPDFSKEGLSNGRNDGTTIDENSSGNIGHASSSPTSNTSNEASNNTGFRNAPVYQPRVTRRARSVDEPMDKVAIYYNYTEMKDIAGFLGDPVETVVTVPKGATHEQVQAIVKSKIDEKKAELAKRGYTFLEDYFVDKPQEDTIRYDYIVNFTKTSSLRMAPTIQPRASRTRRSIEEPKVKTRTITLYYQLAELEIAGSLGNPGQNYVITVPETATAEEIQQAIDQQTSREKASLSRYFQYVGETNLKNDILDRGFGNFDYVITFARRK